LENSLIYILKNLLKSNQIEVDEKELEFQLLSHPSYPSVNSLTGVLDHFRIENAALEVPNDMDSYNDLPENFIAYIISNRIGELVLVVKRDGFAEIILGKKRIDRITGGEFLKVWTGIIVAVEKDEAQVISKKKSTILSSKVFSIFIFVFLLGFFFLAKPDLFQTIHYLLSFVGLAFAIIIVKHEIGVHSVIADKFCSTNIKRIDCDEVLESKGANFFGFVKLSDVGIIYFMALCLSWLLISFNVISFDLIIVISVLAIPFTFYSILYQYFVVKKWCLLCLSIVFTLWLQAGSLLLSDFEISNLSISLNSLALVSFSFLLVISIWQFVLPKLKKEQELNKLKIEHYKFKRNYSIFDALISRSPDVDIEIDSSFELLLGDKSKNAHLKITVITNPLCGHCTSVHNVIEQLLDSKEQNIQICIRFLVNTKDQESIDTQIAQRLLEIYHDEKDDIVSLAIHEVYSDMSPEEWLVKWHTCDNDKYFMVLEKEGDWCLKNNINFTPEILINGRSFPKEYERSDLLYFIDEIIEDGLQKIEHLIPELDCTT
jgi:uncharacterized membrane protein